MMKGEIMSNQEEERMKRLQENTDRFGLETAVQIEIAELYEHAERGSRLSTMLGEAFDVLKDENQSEKVNN